MEAFVRLARVGADDVTEKSVIYLLVRPGVDVGYLHTSGLSKSNKYTSGRLAVLLEPAELTLFSYRVTRRMGFVINL